MSMQGSGASAYSRKDRQSTRHLGHLDIPNWPGSSRQCGARLTGGAGREALANTMLSYPEL